MKEKVTRLSCILIRSGFLVGSLAIEKSIARKYRHHVPCSRDINLLTIRDMILPVENILLGEDVYLAPTAYVGGDVQLGDQCTIMHHVSIRGDVAPIRLGARTNVQDGAVLHTGYGVPLEVASDVAIAHRAVVHGRTIGPRTLIGIGAILLDESAIGEDCIIAAGAVVTPGTIVPAGSVVAGVPGRIVRAVKPADRQEIARIIKVYVTLGRQHAAGAFRNVVPPVSAPPP